MRRLHILTAALLALLVLLGGVYVWQKRQAEKVPPVPRENPAPDIPPTQQDLSTRYPQHIVPIAGTDEVWYQIPELGIQFKIEKSLGEDLIYYFTGEHSLTNGRNEIVGKGKTVMLSTKTLTRFDEDCSPGEDGMLGYISNNKGSPEKHSEYVKATMVKRFENQFITQEGPQSICTVKIDEYKEFFQNRIMEYFKYFRTDEFRESITKM